MVGDLQQHIGNDIFDLCRAGAEQASAELYGAAGRPLRAVQGEGIVAATPRPSKHFPDVLACPSWQRSSIGGDIEGASGGHIRNILRRH